MKEAKEYNDHNIRDDQKFVYKLYAKPAETDNFGCQYNFKRDNSVCTCRKRKRASETPEDMILFSGSPKQVYTYHAHHGSRSFTDVGVGSVKVLKRRNVKRVYLPDMGDRGVGSSDLSSFINRRNKQNQQNSYYDHKITSSKCVGGLVEYNIKRVISEKLSPIIQTISGTTSLNGFIDQRNIEIGSNTIEKNFVTTGTQFEVEMNESIKENINLKEEIAKKPVVKVSEQTQKYKHSTEIHGKNNARKKKVYEVVKEFSSDSLVQHIHNLENPSDEKESKIYIDPMENKLEREYRKMFSTKDEKPSSIASVDKPIPELKSASILRRRFEALRRGLKKDDGKKNAVPSSQDSFPSRKDASVTSDPPSLEGRSYSNTKTYSPVQDKEEQDINKYMQEKYSAHWPKSDMGSDQGVKGMFKLWGKKFNFEEEEKQRILPPVAIDINKKPRKETKNKDESKKKEVSKKKFFFFKKKSKDKPIEKEPEITKPYKPSGVTAGRCEIKDGMTLKIAGTSTPKEQISSISEERDEIQRRTWLKRFISNTIESARSLNVRWNNSMYATSSSTVFELMDTIYRNNGVILKSRSGITTSQSSSYRSYTRNKVNFDQNIEAWMIPKTIPDRPKEIPVRIRSNGEMKEKNIEVTISDQRWFIEKSRAFANKIEVVLRSKNFNKYSNKVSSEYLRIDIPKDFFDASSSDGSKQHPTSDEEVYKIVNYESVMNTKRMEITKDHASDIKVIVSMQDSKNLEAKILETVIKRPPMQRDVVIQGSNVNIPKRCDVIGVGIITQRDMRDIRNKPILKIQYELTDDSEEGLQTVQKKCEFAESYLQEYYKHWTPLGYDTFSWCASDSHLRSSSEKSLISFHNQGDGSKSCPNIYDEFQAPTVISSSETLCCSQRDAEECEPCCPYEDTQNKIIAMSTKAKADVDFPEKRCLPKDSLEVFKRRKIYAASNKSNWGWAEDYPVSVPSMESRGCTTPGIVECPNVHKPIICHPPKLKNKSCKKHVSLPDCETIDETTPKEPEGILSYKGQTGCDACKIKGIKSPMHTVINSKKIHVIPPAPCQEFCEKTKKPPCSLTTKGKPHMGVFSKDQACDPPSNLCAPRRNACPNITQCRKPGSPPCSPPCSRPISPTSSNIISPKPSYCLSPTISLKIKPSSPCAGQSPPRPRRNACPNITQCRKPGSPPCSPPCSHPISPTCSNIPSPKPSFCPSTPKVKSSKNEKRCNKYPCLKQHGSPQRSPNQEPGSPEIKLNSSSCSCYHPPPQGMPSQTHPNPCESDSFPWPINNQSSNLPTPTSSTDDFHKPKGKKKCDKKCPLQPQKRKKNVQKPMKECKPNCASRKKFEISQKESFECRPQRKQSPQQSSENIPLCPAKQPPKPCPELKNKPWPEKQKQAKPNKCLGGMKSKINGLFLKLIPSKKNTSCDQDCTAWTSAEAETGVVMLNSREKITIKMKKETPSTEEIREGMNIKVQDEDGMTLFERKEYTCNHHRPSVLESMYKDSNVNRLSTPVMVVTNDGPKDNVDQNVLVDCKSDPSLANLIEIQFQLKITQGDKTTEIKIAKVDDDEHEKPNNVSKVAPEVLLAKTEQDKRVVEDTAPKNDIDIKIVVKNFKPKAKNKKILEDAYSQKISDKFHTVSTGYSDIEDTNNDTVYSLHKTTIELDNKSKTSSNLSNELASEKITELNNCIVSSHDEERHATDKTDNDDDNELVTINTKSISSCKDKDYDKDTNKLDTKGKELDQDDTLDLNTSNKRNNTNFSSKEEKKELLKKDEDTNELDTKDKESDQDDTLDLNTSNEQNNTNFSSKKEKKELLKKDEDTNELATKDIKSDQDDTIDLNISNEQNNTNFNSKAEKKELLKRVFEKAHTKPKNKKNVRQLRDILKIILTDSSDNDEMNAASNELAKDVAFASLEPNFFKDTDSISSYYKMESFLTIQESKETSKTLYPTEENNTESSSASKSLVMQGCVCSKVADKLNCDLKAGCCCRQKTKLDETTSCDQKIDLDYYKTKYVDVQSQISKHLSSKSNSMNLSIQSHENTIINEKDITENTENSIETKPFTHKNHSKESDLKKMTKTLLAISDDDKIVLINEVVNNTVSKTKENESTSNLNKSYNEYGTTNKFFGNADVLQCYETKKAVLAIYAEKTKTESGERLVAKLPRFVYEKESEITKNYKQIANNSYKSVCRKDLVKMSIK